MCLFFSMQKQHPKWYDFSQIYYWISIPIFGFQVYSLLIGMPREILKTFLTVLTKKKLVFLKFHAFFGNVKNNKVYYLSKWLLLLFNVYTETFKMWLLQNLRKKTVPQRSGRFRLDGVISVIMKKHFSFKHLMSTVDLEKEIGSSTWYVECLGNCVLLYSIPHFNVLNKYNSLYCTCHLV